MAHKLLHRGLPQNQHSSSASGHSTACNQFVCSVLWVRTSLPGCIRLDEAPPLHLLAARIPQISPGSRSHLQSLDASSPSQVPSLDFAVSKRHLVARLKPPLGHLRELLQLAARLLDLPRCLGAFPRDGLHDRLPLDVYNCSSADPYPVLQVEWLLAGELPS